MKALTLHQPWAQLCVTPAHRACPANPLCGPSTRPCSSCGATGRTVKTIETRSWPAPKALIGQRIAIHASARPPVVGNYAGGWVMHAQTNGQHNARCYVGPTTFGPVASGIRPVMLARGAIVGSAVLAACVPMVDGSKPTGPRWNPTVIPSVEVHATGLRRWWHHDAGFDDVSDQLPFGDFAPGRWAWILADAAPTTERCPWCWGGRSEPWWSPIEAERCHVCRGVGRCAPIPAKGRQRVWEWTP